MSLETEIMSRLKEAMKNKDKTALEALRAVKSAILLEKTSGGESFDEIAILQKQIKQRKEAAEQFQAQDRNEMAENELAQAEVIAQFLPEQLSEEELKKELEAIVQETGASSMKDMGKVMGLANQKLAGKADGKAIAQHVKSMLG